MSIGLGAVLGLTLVSGCSSAQRQQNLNDMVKVLNDNGVEWSGMLSGPTAAKVYAQQSFGFGSGGWIQLQVRSPNGLTPGTPSPQDTGSTDTTPDVPTNDSVDAIVEDSGSASEG